MICFHLFSEFLDKHDNTLAFAAFGASYYDSFPIAVLQVAPDREHEEFLLCYHGKKWAVSCEKVPNGHARPSFFCYDSDFSEKKIQK